MLRITGLKLTLDEDIGKLPAMIARKLKVKISDIIEWHIFKQSIDARKSTMIYFVYTVDVSVRDEAYLVSRTNDPAVAYVPTFEEELIETGSEKLRNRPVIVGTGPAGLFAGLFLAQMGYSPLLLERGDDVDTRLKKVEHFWKTGQLDTESNIQFGEGGAGTFSDGKLTTLIKDRRCRKVLMGLVEAGAPKEILYSYKPHIGTDILRGVVKNIRKKITELGGNVQFRACVTDIIQDSGGISGVIVNGKEKISSQVVILATGHSSRDTFRVLHERNVELIPKPFSIGVRIEHPQEMINKAQYKEFAGHPKLGAAEYKLAYHSPFGRSAYTFCMCPGGMVVAASSEEGYLVTNGMSEHARDSANANSALLVGVRPEDFSGSSPLAGIEFQKEWEKAAFILGGRDYRAPAQRLGDFFQGKVSNSWGFVQPTYPRGVIGANLAECFPNYVTETLHGAIIDFDKKITGFAHEDVILTGVETRSSSPVRILRDGSKLTASLDGLYPVGEGAGYAGGIVSAAVDGLKSAEAVVRKYRPIK
ncbi:MAG: hypothetical protein CVU87_06830 [Firmicutes bacterium HGW-Firmicutes-12]|jgi:hypothetical protein|nr:MAG: hypothetical protein CVU87_06830 [Firmicutes bacterium HGW-Firmicutes-12]